VVNYEVSFSPEELVLRGIPHDRQAAVLVHELFGVPSGEIYGYQGDVRTAMALKRAVKRLYGAEGRLRRLSDEEWGRYYPQPWILDKVYRRRRV